jgi:hypothetical protein
MERPKTTIPKETQQIFDHVFANGMGMPIIFEDTPTDDTMKANTWGKVKDATDFIYIKFADGVVKKVALTAL